jgi:multisubunit Na+/H+ antiporter MnhF subunit
MENAESKYDELIKIFKSRSISRRWIGYSLLITSVILILSLFGVLLASLFHNEGIIESNRKSTRQMTEAIEEALDMSRDSTTYKIDRSGIDSLKSEMAVLYVQSAEYTSTRIMTDLALIFLLSTFVFFVSQILLKLYRYEMELSNFYLSLMDAFKIIEMEKSHIIGVNFEKLVNILSIKNISLDTPESPKLNIRNLLSK